jgi:Sulfotransferase family
MSPARNFAWEANVTLSRENPQQGDGTRDAIALPDHFTRNFLPWDCERIVFLHVPKTGGTTLTALLENAVGKSAICPVRFNELPMMTAGYLAQYRVFSGHFDRLSINVIPGMRNVVTLLREPRARIISTYRFWRAHPREEALRGGAAHVLAAIDFDFAGFLRKMRTITIHDVDNMYCRAFGAILPMRGDPASIRNWPLERFGGGERLLDEARKFLAGCAAVGILEEFETSIKLIFAALKLSLPKDKIPWMMHTEDVAQSFNRASFIEEFSINEEAEALLEELTKYDRDLYLYATGLFNARKNSTQVRTQ